MLSYLGVTTGIALPKQVREMGDWSALAGRILGPASAYVCAAIALAAYLTRNDAPPDWRWIWSVAIVAFGLIASAKVADSVHRLVEHEIRQYRSARRIAQLRANRLADEEADSEKRRIAEQESRKATLARLDFLNADELSIVVEALKANTQTINSWLYSVPCRGLHQKGLLAPSQGTGPYERWPWTFPDFVWSELQLRKPELLAKAAHSQGRRP